MLNAASEISRADGFAASPALAVPHPASSAAARPPLRAVLGFVLSWLVFAAILWMPAPDGLSAAGRATLAVVAWASVIWISEAVPPGISGLLIPLLLSLAHAVKPFAAAASGFAAPVVFLCLVAFVFSAVMQLAGLDRRIALLLLDKLKATTANGVIWAMFAVNLLLSCVVPAANARSAALLPVVNGITGLFGGSERERAAKKAIVIQTLVYGSMIAGMCILTAHLPNLVIAGLFEKELGIHVSYLAWFKLQWPYLGMFAITQFWVQHYFKSRAIPIPGGRQAVAAQRQQLPPVAGRDRAILLVFAVVALLWASEPLHGLPTESVALIGLALLFMPGLLQMPWKAIQDQTIWGTVFLVAGALSLSSAISGSGLAEWAAGHIYELARERPWWSVLLIVMAGTHVIRLGMLSNVAAVTMIAPIMLALAPRLGLNPIAFTLLISDTDSFAYLLPTQITAAVIAYSSGAFTMADYARVGAVSVLIAIVYGVVVMAPWYAYMGLPVWDAAATWPF